MGDAQLSLDEAVIGQLESGKVLTRTQFNQVSILLNSRIIHKQISELFEAVPDQFLESLAVSLDSPAAALRIPEKQRIIAQVVRVAQANDMTKALLACEKRIKAIKTASQLHLGLYLSLCVDSRHAKPEVIPSILSYLSLDATISELAVLILVSMLKSAPEIGSSIASYLQNLTGDAPEMSPQSFLTLTKALETFFPIIPKEMTSVYVSQKCKKAFLSRGLSLDPDNSPLDVLTAVQLLEVLSTSCVSEPARKFNSEHYLPLLISGTKTESSQLIKATAFLGIVKLWNFSAIEHQISMESVFTQILSLFGSTDASSAETKALLEALAYLSLGTATKNAIRGNESAVEQLILIMETSHDPSAIYGCLLIFRNLCNVKSDDQDKDTNTLTYLKSMAAEKESLKNNRENIISFNVDLVTNYKLVGSIAGLKQVNANSESLLTQIIYSLTLKQRTSTHREMVAQGGLNLSLKFLINHSRVLEDSTIAPLSDDEDSIELRVSSLRTLATLCRCTNPTLAFSKYDVKSCVPFLLELLGSDSTLMSSLLGPADKLLSLHALTNISTLPDSNLHSLIISRTFEEHLKNLMIDSSFPNVQQAAWELINNVVANPSMLAKFFNLESFESKRNLEILVKMLHSKNEALQEVIAGLIANATMEYDFVSVSILSHTPALHDLLRIMAAIFTEQTQNEGLILRVSIFLRNLVAVANETQTDALGLIRKDAALRAGLKAVVISTKSSEIVSVLRDIIQLAELKFDANN
ncbi:hypothetical protein OY671_001282 [Metschnikowia pulcherrima]|nr:hypothetical protein OY671_001282 [Metschnikowia pulcherrima]